MDPISREVLLVGVDEPLLPALATALERRATRAARVTLTELSSRDPGGVAALVLSTGAARVAQLRMLKGFIDAGRPIVVLSRQNEAADKLKKTTGAAALHLTPEDGAQEVASQLVDLLHPSADISNSETVRPPPGMLPKEVEEELSGPYRHDDVDAAEKKRAGDSELPELESGLLESVRPSSGPPAHPVGAPPPPPPPAAASTAGAAHDAAASAPAEERPHAAATAPLTDAPGFGSSAMPSSAPPTSSRGGAGRAIALGLLGLGVVVVVGVGAWALASGGEEGEGPATSAAEAGGGGDEAPAEVEQGDEPAPEATEERATGIETAETATEEAEQGAEPAPAEPSIPAGGSPEQRIEAARGQDVERDPRESDRLVIEAGRHLDAGNLAEARRVLDRALLLDPDNPRTYAWLGRLHTADGNATLAVQWLELAVQRRPRRSEYRLWLGDALKAAGDVDGARRIWYRIRRDEGDSREVLERLQSL